MAVRALVEIRGLAELRRKLGDLELIVEQLDDPTSDALELLSKRLKFYPPPPPGSTYERTGSLGDSWQETLIMSGTTLGVVYSDLAYAPYVQDDDKQAWVHINNWDTVQMVAEEEEGNIVALYERYLEELINK